MRVNEGKDVPYPQNKVTETKVVWKQKRRLPKCMDQSSETGAVGEGGKG